jgi:hypothetical protein
MLRKKEATVVAEVCLYGKGSYAFLAARPGVQGGIVAAGGWNKDESRPSGELDSLTACVHAAKSALRALGKEFERGLIAVYWPGGETGAITPIDRYESAGAMKVIAAPKLKVSAAQINRAAAEITRPTRARGAELIGVTSSGKRVPVLPLELGVLEKAASAAVHQHGLSTEGGASPEISNASTAARAHVASYAADFTPEDHRDAAKLVEDHVRRTPAIDRHLRYAHNGVRMLHERAHERASEKAS